MTAINFRENETIADAARRLLQQMDARKTRAWERPFAPKEFTGGAGILAIAPKRESGLNVPQIPTPSLARRAWIADNQNEIVHLVPLSNLVREP